MHGGVVFCVFRRYNIMDNMLRMMEKYANNLEEVISDRTRQLMEEKKKADMLLYRMLPAYVRFCCTCHKKGHSHSNIA